MDKARKTSIGVAIFAIAYLAVIVLTRNSYYQLMLTLVPIWAIMGLSWNILSGYSGLVSFGHAAFFGLGAYTTALLFAYGGITPWIGIVAASGVGALAALVIGSITFRLRGHYFALAMLAYPIAMLHVFDWIGLNEVSLPMRNQNPLAFMQFSDPRWFSVFVLVVLLLTIALSARIERSRFGLSLLAIKQNELAAEAVGIHSFKWKLLAIVLSGAIAGLAGGIYAVVLLVVTPDTVFGMFVSAQALIVAMFGGVGTFWGPVIGSVILIPLAEVLHAQFGARLPGIQGIVYGLAIMLVIIKMPQGIAWAIRDLFARKPVRPAAQPVVVNLPDAAPVSIGSDLLVVDGLSRRFGGVTALDDVAMTVKEREILGIIGPNGAGKTTLFNVFNGLVKADRGSIKFDGCELVGLRPSAICAQGIGRTFQVVRPFPRMSLLENVVVGAFVGAPTDAEAIARAREAIARVGLAHLEDLPVSELTNFELRLMELARACSANPRLVLLDEPFAGLAAAEIDIYIALLHRMRRDGLTIAIIEHTMQAMMKLADRFVVLDHGRIIAQGDPRLVVKDRKVVKAYLGDKWMADAEA